MKAFLVWSFLNYLKLLAKIQLVKIRPRIVGIGGSSGKTSVSTLIALILRQKKEIRYAHGLNSETGIPLSILGLDPGKYNLSSWMKVALLAPIKLLTDFEKYDVLVMELGIDGPKPPKNMEYLLSIIRPHIGVLTNISLEHTVYFDKLVEGEEADRSKKILEMIKNDQLLLVKKLKKEDFAILNIDDELVRDALKEIEAKVITISSKNKNSTYFSKEWSPKLGSTKFIFTKGGTDYGINLNRPLPDFYAHSILLSLATCEVLGIDLREALRILENSFDLPGGRLSVFNGIKNTVVIDSSYNNSIEALSGVLDMVNDISEGRRKLGILGDIREQGRQGEELHKKMAEKIIETLDFCILIGPLASQFVAPVLEKNKFNFKSFKTFTDAKDFILENIKDEDLIVVKSSQNTLFLERAVEMLLKDRKDTSKLARRTPYWEEQRRLTP